MPFKFCCRVNSFFLTCGCSSIPADFLQNTAQTWGQDRPSRRRPAWGQELTGAVSDRRETTDLVLAVHEMPLSIQEVGGEASPILCHLGRVAPAPAGNRRKYLLECMEAFRC